jgi:pantoate--beta-alanine ligase
MVSLHTILPKVIMLIFKKKKALTDCISSLKKKSNQIGFVPTMGALHKGHVSLLQESKKNNDTSIVSIFVNPTQFNNQEDLKKYPKTLENDLQLLKENGCDIVFIPTVEEMYSNNISSKSYNFNGIEKQMEGKFRDGHFDGVATIVQSFFNIVNPHRAYFGEKDFQQLQVIKKLVEIENIPTEVIGCPILREKDGLAMSSRNLRLTENERKIAPFIFQTLKKVSNLSKYNSIESIYHSVNEGFDKEQLFNLEYFIIADEETLAEVKSINSTKRLRAFIAVNLGNVRLIDNMPLS